MRLMYACRVNRNVRSYERIVGKTSYRARVVTKLLYVRVPHG